MSLGKAEKICPHDKPGKWKRDAKRSMTKRLRLEAKRDPESAPKKIGNRGWST